MTRRRSVQELVNPLRKLSLLTGHHPLTINTKYTPDLDYVPEQDNFEESHEQSDIISLLPREVVLRIFSLLSFHDLVHVQLTCRLWRRISQDISIWRSRLQTLNLECPDIYAHKPSSAADTNLLSWHARYCQSITLTNWRRGTVQRLHQINDVNDHSRLLCVKLRENTLVTLNEQNIVKIYEYSIQKGFEFKSQWAFKDPTVTSNVVECIDILPDINILVVAQRGLKCMFFDVNKGPKHDPIQILRGGSHPWFIPDSISVNQDYFVLSGRNPSAVFVWNWRKGVKLSHKVFDNQPHRVYLSGESVITINADGLLNVFNIFNDSRDTATFFLNPCSIPCTAYDNSLNLILVPHAARRIHHYEWKSNYQDNVDMDAEGQAVSPLSYEPVSSTSVPIMSHKRRLSNTFIHLLGRKPIQNAPPVPQKSKTTLLKRSSYDFYKSVRLRRHSSYNDYGYACQMKTDQYIKQAEHRIQQGGLQVKKRVPLPDFNERPTLVRSIRTSVLRSASKEIVNVAVSKERLATVNKHGDISIYALNGTTAARVSMPTSAVRDKWMENGNAHVREDDDLSDGYNFMRTRLALGSMGIIYGDKSGCLWWLDFSCRPNV